VKIGELASACGVNIQTVRYYERRGLMPDPRLGVGGYREYDDGDADRLRFVKEAQALGFTLKEIADLLALRSGGGTAREVRERAREKLEGVREKIAALRTLERNLIKLIAGCSGSGSSSSCSILGRLERSTPAAEPNDHRASGRTKRRRTS
jgi:DNA-binding transcriptional MerR regulator